MKKASGRNVTESERNTERINLRLDAEAMETLRFYAGAWKCPMSEVVTCALDSLRADKAINDAMATQHKGKDPTDER